MAARGQPLGVGAYLRDVVLGQIDREPFGVGERVGAGFNAIEVMEERRRLKMAQKMEKWRKRDEKYAAEMAVPREAIIER